MARLHFGLACARGPSERSRAITDIEAAIGVLPADSPAAWVERERERPDRIAEAIEHLELDRNLLAASGQEEAAAGACARADKLRQEARKLATRLHKEAGSHRDGQKNFTDAIVKYDRSIALNPSFADAYFDRGTCRIKVGQFIPGVLDFSRALELKPRFVDQFFTKANYLNKLVDVPKQQDEVKKIVAHHSFVASIVFLRGFFYVASTSEETRTPVLADLEAGIQDFDRTLELNPDHVTAFIYRGQLRAKLAVHGPAQQRAERLRLAMSDYDAALKRDTESGILHYLKAKAWALQVQEPGISSAERQLSTDNAIRELTVALKEKKFGGASEHLSSEKEFAAIRSNPAFVKLAKGH
jgi:tetratricopeptide (TPR) repeat protein